MKKLIYCALAFAAGLFATSCQQENLEPVAQENTVTYTVELPTAQTKGFMGTVSKVDQLVYEVWKTEKADERDLKGTTDGKANATRLYQKTRPMVDQKTVITLNLVQDQEYTILFWAQKAAKEGETSVYNTDNLTDVYYNDVTSLLSNQESYEAYYATEFISDGDKKSRTVVLKRPFAQLNIGTKNTQMEEYTDQDFGVGEYGVEVISSKVTVSNVGTRFNIATPEKEDAHHGVDMNTATSVTFKTATDPSNIEDDPTSQFEYITVNGQEYEYVAMNYLFATGENVTVDYEINTKLTGTNGNITDANVTNIVYEVPLKENYRTNIVGNLLTSSTQYEVVVDATWENEGQEPPYLVELWDGETITEPEFDETAQEFTISSGSDLAWLAAAVNGTLPTEQLLVKSGTANDFEGMKFVLTQNVNLDNHDWTPIGTETNNFKGTFDGNGHTIMNLKIVETEAKEGKAFMGFFGYTKNATIKNVTFENVNVNIACLDIDHSQGHIGAVVGSLEGTATIENVTVKGDIFVEATPTANGASRVAVVAGGNAYGDVTMTNVHVIANEGSYLKANNNVGALAGQLQGKSVFENCSSNIDVTGTKFFAGGIIGLAAGDQLFTNCHTTGNVTITAGREGRANDHYRVGGIAGGWADGATKVCTLVNCSYEGNISGTNSDGSIANPLDYAGYVGRGYTLTNCAGSKVVIDDVEYIQADNKLYGLYIVNGVCAVSTAKEFLAAVANVQEGEVITLTDNITFDETDRTHNSGTYYDGLYYIGDKSFTIDLGNKTISQNGAVNDYLLNFKNDGAKANVITLKNGTVDAGTAAFCALCTSGTSTQELTINLEGVNLINNMSNGSTIKIRGAKTTLNVKSGTKITGKNSYLGIESWQSTINIYDGAEIYMNGTSSYNGCLVGVGGNGVANVYGGYGKGVKGVFIAMTSGGTINVAGGEWIANTDGTVGDNSNVYVLTAQNNKYESGYAGASIINVTGGTFRGGMDAWILNDVNVEKAELNISGGNFNANPKTYVVDGYKAVEANGVYNVVVDPVAKIGETEYATLQEAFIVGGNVTLLRDVTITEPATLAGGKTAVLDLNGKTLTAELVSALVSTEGSDLTVKNGKVVAYESTVRAVGGKAVVESGEYTSIGTAVDSPATYRYSLDCREGGELIIDGGTFKSNNGMINVGSTVTINGGKFENIVEKTMTRHFAYVSAPLTINDGEFYGQANSSAGGCFFCCAAEGGNIQVNGGKFTSLWTSGSVNRIFEYYYGGTITVTGGMFNTNGGIATFVTENTDEATKAAYPYVAK